MRHWMRIVTEEGSRQWKGDRVHTLRILPTSDLEEVLDVCDFRRHVGWCEVAKGKGIEIELSGLRDYGGVRMF
jgi:hypothetical protein